MLYGLLSNSKTAANIYKNEGYTTLFARGNCRWVVSFSGVAGSRGVLVTG
ncbi:hypothetical protein MELA_00636 [Candidatus Methylomirabilis lanthanidiphila]|uniref:Uncharacterized protein n=1 Tax=Candidatus Methylomirabilis lanthanidiphila TaxID=2211376 RepID=A0A564ZG33_9BACT|nr:hypothetical protein MELA_00636 [Candidatus Methylomirabilis lanthanidiphila]